MPNQTQKTWRAICINPKCPEHGYVWDAPDFLKDCPDCGKPLMEATAQFQRLARNLERSSELWEGLLLVLMLGLAFAFMAVVILGGKP
ncbi:hypothetical protein [Meiothermus granaticius]|uniref:Uncharacterized protein n=1 Tax=Meiothermus granaticius NBRC 107808 TaxID=1227551 RepID=A0A399FEP6_9DEIN|nr:hypothetical protein [Meiothermus granaticius]RIH94019.1 hypothetical protein Mgrana_00105 [Meiothermus granaticius NBRC 107808]GEM88152.1 hypothetical protein MGR01S_27770 [Meiothermus granaticius NBRC 107808]